jgi:hypothetical protein
MRPSTRSFFGVQIGVLTQPNKDQTIHRTEDHTLVASLDVKLMTKDQELSFPRGPRPDNETSTDQTMR